MFNGSNCDRKSQLSGTLAEPLNPRELTMVSLKPYNLINNVKNNVVFLTLTKDRQAKFIYRLKF